MIYSLKNDGEKKITPNFKIKEFACKDSSDKIIIEEKLIEIIQQARCFINQPIKIISGYRTESYNERCGGAKNSYHLKGMACDIRPYDYDLKDLAIVCASFGAKGIGIYKIQNFIHIDIRPNLYIFKGE